MNVSGTLRGVLLQVQAYEVHGQRGWRILWRADADPAGAPPRESLLSTIDVLPRPQPGDLVEASILMGEAIGFRKAPNP
jgi:hypothetical protein